MPKSFEFTLLRECPHCGDPLSIGRARCSNPACSRLRPEFQDHAAVVVRQLGPCRWCGHTTDVRLPDGTFLWAPYFLDAWRAGWLDASYVFTEAYRTARGNRNRSSRGSP
jgi:hypothetical protein